MSISFGDSLSPSETSVVFTKFCSRWRNQFSEYQPLLPNRDFAASNWPILFLVPAGLWASFELFVLVSLLPQAAASMESANWSPLKDEMLAVNASSWFSNLDVATIGRSKLGISFLASWLVEDGDVSAWVEQRWDIGFAEFGLENGI